MAHPAHAAAPPMSNTDSGGLGPGGLDQSADITENIAHDRPRTQNRE